jgi:Protein of unknown function (DUF982)
MAWGDPVSIQLPGLGKSVVIDSTAAAAEYLVENWPYEARRHEYWLALQCCFS